MIIDNTTSNLCFDDILLVPKHSEIESRSNIDISSKIGNPKNPSAWISMKNPFLMAPMEFISSISMIEIFLSYGGIAFINRFQHDELRIKQLEHFSKNEDCPKNLGFSLSYKDVENKDFIKRVIGSGVKILLIDTALGHTKFSVDSLKTLRSMVSDDIHIMTGNVSSYEAYRDLMDAGSDSVRVGIGGGAACTTRIVTGFGVPVLSSIMDIYEHIKDDPINGLVSDGGIKQNGDIVKALAAGASAVMMGTLFAGHEECDGKVDGKFLFRGLASASIQIDPAGGTLPELSSFHVEGVHGYIENKGSVHNTINQMINNTKSGFSYCGSENLKSFQNDCKFIKVSSQSLKESNSRI